MRIALVSDIHGNLVSLEAVLADIDQSEIDQIICLGDVATLGPQPSEVLARIRALDCACIMGNHDSFLQEPALGHTYMEAPWFAEHITWCIDKLSPDDLKFVRTFQPTIEVPLNEEGSLLCFHGSPRSNQDIILATTRASELDEMLNGHTALLMAGGHTHIQMMRQHNGLIIVNPGSVGLPFERLPFADVPRILPWAEYAIISWVNSRIGIDLRRVSINLAAVKQSANDSDMPDKAGWLENWIEP